MSGPAKLSQTMTILIGFLAAGNLLNGAWMLADPPHWYENLPAAVPDYGPMNEHFIRDIGALFVLMGAGLLLALRWPAWRLPVIAAVAGFHVLHGAIHVLDTARGLVGPEHWLLDLPAIYVPAVVLVWMTIKLQRSES